MHLTINGFDPNFTVWKWHIEEETLNDVARTIEMIHAVNENALGDIEGFQKLLEDAKKPLFKVCTKFTKLSVVVKLFNIKAKSGWSVKKLFECTSAILQHALER